MSIQLNQAIVIFFVWVFCLLEDKWFDKLLRYQIEGRAEKVSSSAKKAIYFYNKKKHGFLWVMLAIALTIILLSFHIDSMTVRIAVISIGVLIGLIYVILKLMPYNKSSAMLNKR